MRFPEFTGDWRKLTIDDICSEFQSGKFIRADMIQKQGTIPVYGGNGLRGYTDTYNHVGDYVLIGRQGALCGNVRFVTDKTYITEHAIAVKGTNDNNTKFLQYLFEKMNLGQYSDQSAQPGLAVNKLLKLKISIPYKNEQQKIAKLLHILDERITTQSGLIEKLESLISGIIERITAQSPNVRIADCLDCHSSTLQENQLNEAGGYRVYGANGICGYTDNPGINCDAILIVKDGSGVGNVSYTMGEYSVIGTSNYLTAKNGYSLRYLYFSLKKFNFAPYKTGMAIPHIYFKDYGKAKIYCPSLEEQERIANNLSKIERKIEIERSIKDCCIVQKQYLLQQMFI